MHTYASSWRLLLRCFVPSVFSAGCYFVLTLLLVGTHLLLLSLNAGVFAPGVFGQQGDLWVTLYSAHVLQPLDAFVHNRVVNTVLLAIVWGFIGCMALGLLAMIVDFIHDFRREEKSVAFTANEGVVHHPLRRTLLLYWLWRFFMGMVTILITVTLLPVVHDLLLRDAVLLQSATVQELLKNLSIVYLSWMAIIHLYVVCLRLFILRPRVFGDTAAR